MDTSRIAELLAPFLQSQNSSHRSPSGGRGDDELAFLSPSQLQSISTYINILKRWNARVNLTSIRNEDKIVTRHFGESLFAARCLFPVTSALDAGTRPEVADVGSGAGFPGIPLKLWVPQISLTLIESNHKKATFLREVARALTLTDVDIQNSRAESLPPHSYDLVTLRAVERFETILPIGAALLSPAGRLAILIGSSQLPTAQTILPAFQWLSPIPIPQSTSRILAVGTPKSSKLGSME